MTPDPIGINSATYIGYTAAHNAGYAAGAGLIASTALLLMDHENFINYKSFLIFGAAFILIWKFKLHPILMIFLPGMARLILYRSA
jgi:chromate transporter